MKQYCRYESSSIAKSIPKKSSVIRQLVLVFSYSKDLFIELAIAFEPTLFVKPIIVWKKTYWHIIDNKAAQEAHTNYQQTIVKSDCQSLHHFPFLRSITWPFQITFLDNPLAIMDNRKTIWKKKRGMKKKNIRILSKCPILTAKKRNSHQAIKQPAHVNKAKDVANDD